MDAEERLDRRRATNRKSQARARAQDPDYGRRGHKRMQGITLEEYDALLSRQDGRCAICRTTEPAGPWNRFYLDHDHACCGDRRACAKCRRGLLCNACNLGIGRFGDDPQRLRAAADYLERFTPPG